MTIEELIKYALEEDMPEGDISSMYLFENEQSFGRFIAKEEGVLSGVDICKKVFQTVDSSLEFETLIRDGNLLHKGDVIATVFGSTKSILMAERVGLNFMQRMSGVATKTYGFAREMEGTKTQILDTRKTTPLLRKLEKQAVLDGGGINHRFSLSDMVMLKDNHLKAAESIKDAVNKVKHRIQPNIKIEVEVEDIEMFKEALKTDCDIIMLDNMNTDTMRKCVEINSGKKKLEASGNMTIARVREVALTGVDFISVGALTHSYSSLDISLKFS